ncbi:MAG: CvpA family protein [Pirellulales bacterium]
MQAYDVLMLVVLIGATLFGAGKGMAWQLASLTSLVCSYLVALRFSPQWAPLFGREAPLNRLIAMVVLFILTSLAIWMVFRVVARFIDRMRLKDFDRQLGALLGLAKGVLLCVVITLVAASFLPPEHARRVIESRSGYYIAILIDRSHNLIPKEAHTKLHPYFEKAQQTLDATATRAESGASRAEGQ